MEKEKQFSTHKTKITDSKRVSTHNSAAFTWIRKQTEVFVTERERDWDVMKNPQWNTEDAGLDRTWVSKGNTGYGAQIDALPVRCSMQLWWKRRRAGESYTLWAVGRRLTARQKEQMTDADVWWDAFNEWRRKHRGRGRKEDRWGWWWWWWFPVKMHEHALYSVMSVQSRESLKLYWMMDVLPGEKHDINKHQMKGKLL